MDRKEILLVDDDPADAVLVKEGFRDCCIDVKVHHASGGEEALQWLEQRHSAGLPVPVIMTDLSMPGMDGFELMERIRSDSRWDDTSILVLSNSKRADDRQRSFELGAHAYLAKAADLDEFFTMMRCVYENWVNPKEGASAKSTPWITLPK